MYRCDLTSNEHNYFAGCRMRVVYAKMKLGQVALGLPILSALLRCAKDLGEWLVKHAALVSQIVT